MFAVFMVTYGGGAIMGTSDAKIEATCQLELFLTSSNIISFVFGRNLMQICMNALAEGKSHHHEN